MISQEQEVKVMLTQSQADAIAAAYPFSAPFTQTNTYYDTPDQALRQQGLGLRIRQFATHAEQTLKVPAAGDRVLTELTDPLSVATARALTAAGRLQADGLVARALTARGVDWAQLAPFAQATTTRRLCQQAEGLLTLDETCYANRTRDRELELEFTDAARAKPFFAQLIARFQLDPTPPRNKVARAAQNVK
ncbi:CYTH domain-containing protein [Lacticaseibacillus absianus]|uniref:CYTH domain-containing protein n=1 Tax=Lacticaseibacillus absianus TaxID=2729623 RepID=UPI0015C9CB76|nr:CYTH domain-containing protein [Lacticaseibacillus absianus]